MTYIPATPGVGGVSSRCHVSEAGVSKLRRPTPQFWPRGGHQLFMVAMLWYGVHSLHTATAETLVVDVGHLKDGLGSGRFTVHT